MAGIREQFRSTDSMFECCICKNTLKNSILLACLHNCCKDCFEKATSTINDRNITCCTCNEITQAGTERPNRLLDYQLLLHVLSSESKMCDWCLEREEIEMEVSACCLICKLAFCTNCKFFHGMAHKDHKTLTKDEIRITTHVYPHDSYSQCTIHGKPLEIACVVCEQAKCVRCWTEFCASSHEKLAVNNELFTNHLHELTERVKSMESDLLRKLTVLEQIPNALKVARDKTLSQIEQRKILVSNALDTAFRKIQSSTKDKFEDVQCEAEGAVAEANRIMATLTYTRSYFQRLLESRYNLEIFDQQKTARMRLEDLLAKCNAFSDMMATMRTVVIRSSLPEDLSPVFNSWMGELFTQPADVHFDEDCKSDGENTQATVAATSLVHLLVESQSALADELEKFDFKKFGKFTYYLLQDKLVVHLEDENARKNQTSLTFAIEKIVRSCFKNVDPVSVVVFADKMNAELCSPGIGIATVGNMSQTVGMYVTYCGVIYWVSVAHNFVCIAPQLEKDLTVVREQDTPEVRIDFENDSLGAAADSMVLCPVPYACFTSMPRDQMGRILLHTVDIMMGYVPMTRHFRAASMKDVCLNERLIRKVLRPMRVVGSMDNSQYSRYVLNLELHWQLTAMLPGCILAEGTIVSEMGFLNLGGQIYQNSIIISSTNDVFPRIGDCGSIWVNSYTNDAVAITVGKLKTPFSSGGSAWIAVLLFPILEALCQKYSGTFSDMYAFTSLAGERLFE